MDETQSTENGRDRTQNRRLGRFSAALAGAAALVVLSVGVALAAGSDEGDGSLPTVSESASPSESETAQPPDTGGSTSDASGGTTAGLNEGADGGTDPDASETPVDPEPSAPADLEELNRRIAELDAKVDQLPTKQELADALRAFADQLDNS